MRVLIYEQDRQVAETTVEQLIKEGWSLLEFLYAQRDIGRECYCERDGVLEPMEVADYG